MIQCNFNNNAIRGIIKNLDNSVYTGVEEILKKGQEIALSKKAGNKSKELIKYEIHKTRKGTEGRIYTDFDYALFLEFGTGIKSDGTMPHIGRTLTFKESGMRYWYLPVDKAPRNFGADRIVLIHVKDRNGNYTNKVIPCFIMYAQSPIPYMRPTAFELENVANTILANEITKKLRS